jgi:hypothetical protein
MSINPETGSTARPLRKLSGSWSETVVWRLRPGLRALLRCFGSVGAPALIGISTIATPQLGNSAEARVILDTPLIVTQVPHPGRPADGNARLSSGALPDFPGARLVLVQPTGATRELTRGFYAACDPDVSFDAQHILFAGKPEAGSRWRIYEVGLDGSNPHPISPDGLEARSPIYVSTLFTLNSPEPWFTLLFVGAEASLNEAGGPSASSLYNIRLDGGDLRRLTYNPNLNLDPTQTWDGRVIYSAERFTDPSRDASRAANLYAIHIEGADMELYGGELSRNPKRMPCVTADGLVVFVEPEKNTADGAGQLACVEQRRPHVTYQRLTQDRQFVYRYPTPGREGAILVSCRPRKGSGRYAIYSFTPHTKQSNLVFDDPRYDQVQVRLAGPRPRPDGHSTVVDTKFNTGTFYGLNAYDADPRLAAYLTNGAIKRVRFLEGIPQPPTATEGHPAARPFLPRRLVGEAPVEEDGSFNVEVPASTPLLLQTVDEKGMALAECGWIWVQPKETRGCIGCHEDPERVPENDYVLALRRPSNRLTLPPDQRRAVTFRKDIAPILSRHCAMADCHGGKEAALHLPLTEANCSEVQLHEAYKSLMAPAKKKAVATGSKPGKYVNAGKARTSWLMWQLSGTNTSRAWDNAGPEKAALAPKVRLMPPAEKGQPLSDEDLRTIAQWIDLGAPYDIGTTTTPTAVQRQAQAR